MVVTFFNFISMAIGGRPETNMYLSVELNLNLTDIETRDVVGYCLKESDFDRAEIIFLHYDLPPRNIGFGRDIA